MNIDGLLVDDDPLVLSTLRLYFSTPPAASIEVATPRNASCPALPTSSKARLTSALPSTPRRIETLVVDIGGVAQSRLERPASRP